MGVGRILTAVAALTFLAGTSFAMTACGESAGTSATTVGLATHEYSALENDFMPLESVLLAVELDDGTALAATASETVLKEVGMWFEEEVVSEVITWGDIYLVVEDPDPDRVILEETSADEWMVMSVEG